MGGVLPGPIYVVERKNFMGDSQTPGQVQFAWSNKNIKVVIEIKSKVPLQARLVNNSTSIMKQSSS